MSDPYDGPLGPAIYIFKRLLIAAAIALVVIGILIGRCVHGADLIEISDPSICQPCRDMLPVVAQLEREGYGVQRFKPGESPYPSSAIPTFYAVDNGRVVARRVGVQSIEALRLMLGQPLVKPLTTCPLLIESRNVVRSVVFGWAPIWDAPPALGVPQQ